MRNPWVVIIAAALTTALLGAGCYHQDDFTVDGGTDAGGDSDSNSDTDTDTNSDTDTGSDDDDDTDTGPGTDTDTDTEEDAGIDSGVDSGPDSGSNSSMTDCEGGKMDPETNLCWENPPKENTYDPWYAQDYCSGLGEGWRLPKIQELISLIRGCDQSYCGVTDPDCLEQTGCDDECISCPAEQGPGEDGCYWDPALSGPCLPQGYLSSSQWDSDHRWALRFDLGAIANNDFGNVRCVKSE